MLVVRYEVTVVSGTFSGMVVPLTAKGDYDYVAPPGVWINNIKELLPAGQAFEGEIEGHPVKLLNAKQL